MTSAIDTSFITTAPVDKAPFKLALDTAASEITALQADVATLETDVATIESNITTLQSNRVLKAGDTMTGDLTITSTDPTIMLNSVAPQQRAIVSMTGATARWTIELANNTAESGSNAGSNFAILRHSDAGTVIDAPLFINRATGAPTFANAGLWRTGLSAPPIPTSVSGVGLFVPVNADLTNTYTLPAGGTWAYCIQGFAPGGSIDGGTVASVSAGGTTLSVGAFSIYIRGFIWRLT